MASFFSKSSRQAEHAGPACENLGAASAQDSVRIAASLREGHVCEMRQFLALLQPETASEALGLLRRAFPTSVLSERVEACETFQRHRTPHAA